MIENSILRALLFTQKNLKLEARIMRIFYTKSNGDKIYGAVMVTPTRFLHKMDSLSGERHFIFDSKEYGDVYVTESMLDRIIARFKANNLSTEILEQAKNAK